MAAHQGRRAYSGRTPAYATPGGARHGASGAITSTAGVALDAVPAPARDTGL
jgi:hypothetical protein